MNDATDIVGLKTHHGEGLTVDGGRHKTQDRLMEGTCDVAAE